MRSDLPSDTQSRRLSHVNRKADSGAFVCPQVANVFTSDLGAAESPDRNSRLARSEGRFALLPWAPVDRLKGPKQPSKPLWVTLEVTTILFWSGL